MTPDAERELYNRINRVTKFMEDLTMEEATDIEHDLQGIWHMIAAEPVDSAIVVRRWMGW